MTYDFSLNVRCVAVVLVLVCTLLTGPTVLSSDSVCSVASGKKTVALLELYTSEGCSSCPPADAWLSSLPARGLTPERLVPLALHVDYWNYLGWKDPYSKKAFTQRQQNLTRLQHARTVYTPQFVLNGNDYRRWKRRDINSEINRINRNTARARLELELAYPRAGVIEISGKALVTDRGERTDTDVFLAVYENNLTNMVNAGENTGRTLDHHFVVRRLIGPIRVGQEGAADLRYSINLDQAWKRNDLGVAAFVQNRITGAVLQALALPACVQQLNRASRAPRE